MIADDVQLGLTVAQLERMYRALAALRREVYPVNSQQFALLDEGPEEEIRRLQAAIDIYTGRDELARIYTPA